MFGWFAPGMALAVVSVALARRERPWRPAELVARHPALVWAAGIAAAVVLLAPLLRRLRR